MKDRSRTDVATVLFDWRGTLAVTPPDDRWVGQALELAGRDRSPAAVRTVLDALAAASPDRLEAHGVDCSQAHHRRVYQGVFVDAGLDNPVAESLYEVESDWGFNPFVADAAPTLHALHRAGIRLGVVSDIHFDIRPAFVDAGLHECIDSYVLSFEHGVQKPDPAIFDRALAELSADPASTLMVGDRPSHDAGAVACGVATLVVPSATSVSDRRLGLVTAAVLG